ncbi:hypothetical protein LTR53_008627 [Teratosphaeriaceae sp. CCFEE 6253]|nr:hypothetical protein LTR53_008627 [Teratosphaeriaceae sp. CCFEE 6253]
MPRHRVVCFDFMGTCLDWHTAVVDALPNQIPEHERSQFAIQWRQSYFDANAERQAHGDPPEDIDITHRRVLLELLAHPERLAMRAALSGSAIDVAVEAWHHQKAWPDVVPALATLRERGYEIIIHANGTTRLQLDLELLGVYKPAPEAYLRGLQLLKRTPEECVMVAAHAYDTRGAKAVGMKTIYIYRWTDDVLEDQAVVREENDAYLESMDGLVNAVEGLAE